MESAFDFTIASIHQKSAFQNTPSVPAQFYFLQYGLQREFLMTKKLRLWTGPGISLRAVSRETGNTKTGEAIASLDGRVKMVYKFSNARKLEGALGLPLFSQLVYRGYALSDLVTGITGWGSLQSFQIRLAYLIPLGDRLEFVLGYDTWFLHYLVREPVWILNQQYFGSLRINLMRNAETRQ